MATKGAQAAGDSTDSDDSMEGHPNFSAEERALPDDLLKNSNEFIRLYEEHQPELQQIIEDLEKSSYKLLHKYDEATRQSRAGGITSAAGTGVGLGLGFLLAPFTLGGSLLVGAAVAGAATTSGAICSHKANRNKKEEEEKALEDVKKALQTFNTTAKTVTKHLHNICNQVEKILQYQKDEQSRLLKSEVKEIRKHADDLSELAKLFTSEDLQRLLEQGTITIDGTENINPFITFLLTYFGFLSVFEDNRTLRDFEKLRIRRFGVQEYELESKAGRFILKMRETIDQLQNTLNEMNTSKTEVENVIVLNLKKYIRGRNT
ncbi:uncharacterized protein LOC118801838 [Colossoma macropomum]|uniref:uncharacterized protein LOC118801838 n=1 Tax=Colossoma macropomum TaxID=42526 RepID=UPI0018656201|nr:uncharacterized protein LOC118801838 [Colossoma macropomum]XP_036418111.1 uncharacterized protein LOC118801838 [Colossoma macropomum]